MRLIVPAKYKKFTSKRQTAKIFNVELPIGKKLFVSLELYKEKRFYRTFLVYQEIYSLAFILYRFFV